MLRMRIWIKGNLANDLGVEDQIVLQMMILDVILQCCSKETSSDPENWSENNRAYGHCVIIALAVQAMYGGELLRASLEDLPKYAQMRSHYWNRLPNGTEVDLSASQFDGADRHLVQEGKPITGQGLPLTAEELLKNPETRKRFKILAKRISENKI